MIRQKCQYKLEGQTLFHNHRARLQDLVRFGQILHALQFAHRLGFSLNVDPSVFVHFVQFTHRVCDIVHYFSMLTSN